MSSLYPRLPPLPRSLSLSFMALRSADVYGGVWIFMVMMMTVIKMMGDGDDDDGNNDDGGDIIDDIITTPPPQVIQPDNLVFRTLIIIALLPPS